MALLVTLAVTAALLVLTCWILARSFLRIATASGSVSKVKYREKAAKLRSVPRAMFGKELARFTASPNYMLNCGLGLLFLPIVGILLLVKAAWVRDIVALLEWDADFLTLMLSGALCSMASMVDITAPSVSLEGKSLWLAQSLPILPWEALRAKLRLQVILAGVPLAFASLCAILALRPGLSGALLLLLLPQVFSVLMAAFGLFLNLKRPNFHWTSEIAPIKQSLSVTAALFGGLVLAVGLMVAGWLLRNVLSPMIMAWACTVILAAAAAFLLHWLKTAGAKTFAAL